MAMLFPAPVLCSPAGDGPARAAPGPFPEKGLDQKGQKGGYPPSALPPGAAAAVFTVRRGRCPHRPAIPTRRGDPCGRPPTIAAASKKETPDRAVRGQRKAFFAVRVCVNYRTSALWKRSLPSGFAYLPDERFMEAFFAVRVCVNYRTSALWKLSLPSGFAYLPNERL